MIVMQNKTVVRYDGDGLLSAENQQWLMIDTRLSTEKPRAREGEIGPRVMMTMTMIAHRTTKPTPSSSRRLYRRWQKASRELMKAIFISYPRQQETSPRSRSDNVHSIE